ncbi:MAG TPA: hypothetical protein VK636_03565 [Gemmatimonadaceae bacterium]|nr:hypothetical protein [Gemmatimonadaceae bacterium]
MSRSTSHAQPSRHGARPNDSGVSRTVRFRRAIPWWAIVITVLVLVTAPFAVEPVWDAATFGSVGEGRLDLPSAYMAIAPLSNVLDTLTLLTVAQHVAIFIFVLALFTGWRAWRGRTRRPTPRGEFIAAVVLIVTVVVIYVVGVLLPRPMAQLVLSDPEVVSIDFHAHTKYSHDGRSGWTEEDVRDWHRAAGFDVAYITDHATFEGAERGVAGNPGLAGQGTVLLQGLEAFYRGEHVNILSAGRRFRGITTKDMKDVDEEALALASLIPATSPLLIETIPGNLSKMTPAKFDGGVGVRAIEIVDGSPRGLAQGRKEHDRIVKLADTLNLALVTGSDNHGWGHAAPGWTLMRVPGWRGMTTDSLSRRVEDILRIGRRESTKTIERRVASATDPMSIIFAGPAVFWRMLTTLSPDERVIWLMWVWGLVIVIGGLRSYRIRPSATA